MFTINDLCDISFYRCCLYLVIPLPLKLLLKLFNLFLQVLKLLGELVGH